MLQNALVNVSNGRLERELWSYFMRGQCTEKQPDKKTAGTAGGQDFRYSRGPKIWKQPEAKNQKYSRGARGQKVIKLPEFKNMFFLKINKGQFCPRCPAGGPDLENSCFFGNKRRSVLSLLPCGRPRPGKSSCDFRHHPAINCKKNKCAKKIIILWKILWSKWAAGWFRQTTGFHPDILRLCSTLHAQSLQLSWFSFLITFSTCARKQWKFRDVQYLARIAWDLVFEIRPGFSGWGRPEGNQGKTWPRLFGKKYHFSRSGPPAGQRGQNWPSFM